MLIGMLLLACAGPVFAAGTDADTAPAVSDANTFFGRGTSPVELADDGSLIRMLLALLLVGAMAVGVMLLSKKILPRVAGMTGKRVRVVETISLGSRRAVHLLTVGDREILIGSTQNTITRLADWPVETPAGPLADEIITTPGEEMR